MPIPVYLVLACCSMMLCFNAMSQVTPIETWEFDDVSGTILSNCTKGTGTAVFSGETNAATDGAGQLLLSHSDTNYYRNTGSAGVQSSGDYQLEFKVTAVDLSRGDATGANFGFGLWDSVANADLFLIRVSKSNSRLLIQTRMDGSNSTIYDFGSGVTSASNFVVRCSIDLTEQDAEIYLTTDGGAEQLVTTVALSTQTNQWDQVRYVSNANDEDWGTGDTAEVDYLRISSGKPLPTSYTPIPLSSTELYVQGAKFTNIDEVGMNFHRFDSSILESTTTIAKVNPVRAKTTSGVKLTFYTRAPSAKLQFAYTEGDENRNSTFVLYQNGINTGTQYVSKDDSTVDLTIHSLSASDELVRHDIVLPNWSNPILTNIEIESGYSLEAAAPIRQSSIAFLGDSISHGSGQGSTHETYPFIATEKLNAQLYNLAVGGGKISPPVADMLQHFEPLDAIWVLVGYNNWQGSSHDIATITAEYEALLTNIRTHQPDAEVFCSTLTYARKDVDVESQVTAEEVRTAVAGVVNARINAGDTKLHLIRSEEFTDDSYLRFEDDGVTPVSDPVHFGVDGAAMFGDDVYQILNPYLMPDGASGVWDFDYGNTGNTALNRATSDDSLEAELYIDGVITTDAQEGEALSGRARITGFDLGTDSNLSVEFALKTSELSGQQRLVRMVTGTTGFYVGLQDGKVTMKLNAQAALTGSTVLTADTWHTLAATWNRDTRRATIYLDGVEQNTAVYPGEVLPAAATDALTIGLSGFNIDRVRVANRVADFTAAPSIVNYDDWSSSLDWNGETQTSELEDPDNDGFNNLEEFIFELDPIVADTVSKDPVLSGTEFSFTLGRSSQDIEYLIVFSNDLQSWSTLQPLELHGRSGDFVSVDLSQHIMDGNGFAQLIMRGRAD